MKWLQKHFNIDFRVPLNFFGYYILPEYIVMDNIPQFVNSTMDDRRAQEDN